jgi:hypothetical protein
MQQHLDGRLVKVAGGRGFSGEVSVPASEAANKLVFGDSATIPRTIRSISPLVWAAVLNRRMHEQ